MAPEVSNKAGPAKKSYTRFGPENYDQIPQELRDTPQWECWKLIDGRKVPIDATTGKPYPPGKQDSDRMGNATFEQVCALLAKRKDLQGVGFRFKSADPFTGMDLDDVRDPKTGELAMWVREIVAQFDTYAEVSPSGTGLHIIGKAKIPKALTKTQLHSGHIEIYSEGRYFTITGQKVPAAKDRISDTQVQTDYWYYLAQEKTPAAKNGNDPAALTGGEKIPKGSQDNWLTSAAGLYRAKGDPVETVVKKLLIDYHDHCAPPHNNKKRVEQIARGVCQRYKQGEKDARKATPAQVCITEVTLEAYSAIAPEHLDFSWRNYLARGKLHHLAGNSGEGKTPVVITLATSYSTGRPWPDGSPNPNGPRSVIILSAEDDPNDTMRPRLDLAGADVDKIFRIRCTMRFGDKVTERMFALNRDLEALLELADQVPDLGAVIIDPVTNYLGQGVKMNVEEEVRALLMPLVEVARARRFDAITVGHLNRREKGTNPFHRIMGAAAFGGVARFIYMFGPDPDDTNKHAHIMAQLRGVSAPTLRYQTFQNDVSWEGKSSPVVGVTWRGKSEATAEDAVDPDSGKDKAEYEKAGKALTAILSQGRLPAKKAQEKLKEAGFDVEKLHQTRVMRAAGAGSKRFPGESYYSWFLLSGATE
jgi:putative DNA primase/helicase